MDDFERPAAAKIQWSFDDRNWEPGTELDYILMERWILDCLTL